jgi:hypothetical protein
MLADLVPVRVWEFRGQFSHCVLSPVHEARVRGGLCCQQTTSFLNFTPGSRIRESANSVCYKLGDGSTRQSGIAAGCVGETFRRSTQNGKPLLLALRPNRMVPYRFKGLRPSAWCSGAAIGVRAPRDGPGTQFVLKRPENFFPSVNRVGIYWDP